MLPVHDFPAFARPGVLNAVIEVSAGTNMKHMYDPDRAEMVPVMLDGMPHRIKFLPYPGNYGFIPSTLVALDQGGDGHPLDVLVLAEYMPLGTVLEVVPLAVLKLLDAGKRDDKIIAIPVDRTLQIFHARDLGDLRAHFPRVPELIEEWFTYYDATQPAQALGWEDRTAAIAAVEHWTVH